MYWQKSCIYCNERVYTLKENNIKCSVCKKKYAKAKTNKTLQLIELFCQNRPALEAAKNNALSYGSVKSYYDTFQQLCTYVSEKEYERIRHKESEYEEYFYLEKSKRNNKERIFEAKNFLTFDYDGHIYTILLPSLEKFKAQFIEDDLAPTYYEEFQKFKRQTRLIKISSHYNRITEFWDYFERFILPHKGVSSERFILYLKECEFTFNHSYDQAVEILTKEYFSE